jgi:AraC-like DNA-binding protein
MCQHAAVNRIVPLVRTAAVLLERFDHVPGVAHRDPERERAAGHAVNFLESGSFRIRTSGAWQKLTAGSMFVTMPGLEFTCRHEGDHPTDSCLSVRYSEEVVESARSWAIPTAAPIHQASNRQAYLGLALRECHPADQARTEALAAALLWTLSTPDPGRRLYRPDRLAWYAARVDRAKTMIETHYAEPLSLSDLARDAGMSLFHFARVFAELEGRPPHRFLIDVRLARAAARLRDGASVTDTCFAVGFGSLSHFVTTFRRRYGVRPSDAARSITS